jgi:hypothetical protein
VVWRGRGVHFGGGYNFACTIRDLSDTGARIAVRGAPIIPSRFHLINVTSRTAHEVQVAWNDGKQLGLQFVNSFSLDQIPEPGLNYLRGLAQ